MTIFKAALALLSIVKVLLELVEKRKAEDAALASILLKMLEDADGKLAEVRAASDAARERARSGGLSDDDFRD